MNIPSYVIQASPLSKLFMLEWQSKCEANPDVVFDETPFNVMVPRSGGALHFVYNKPVHISKVLPVQPYRKKDEYPVDDLDGTIMWLIGGEDGQRSEETDIYGVVGLAIDMDISSALADVSQILESDGEASKKVQKTYADMQKDLLKKTKDGMKAARELADGRVRRALKITHSNLVKQFETLRTEGKGVYTPSVAEAVGAHILAAEIESSGANRRKMFERLNTVMNSTSVLS